MKKLISLVTALVIILSLTSCNTKTDELQNKVEELQSQVSSLQSEVSPSSESISEDDIPNIDLRALADKIVKECPPPDGVELVYEDINIPQDQWLFNKDTEFIIDLNTVQDYLRIYNPNPTKDEEVYHILLAKIAIDQDIKDARRSLSTSFDVEAERWYNIFRYAVGKRPKNYVLNYIYDVATFENSDKIELIIQNNITL